MLFRRGFIIELPVAGGQSRFSTNGGVTFRALYIVRKE
jgi:hypothetical protein